MMTFIIQYLYNIHHCPNYYMLTRVILTLKWAIMVVEVCLFSGKILFLHSIHFEDRKINFYEGETNKVK